MEPKSESTELSIRAHNLLCLIGFEGCGYSESFVENMSRIKARLWGNSRVQLRILAEPDDICAACPNLRQGECYLRNQPNERAMKSQDLDVAERLGLEPGRSYLFQDLIERVQDSVAPEDLKAICGPCPWLSSGVCAKALAAMRRE